MYPVDSCRIKGLFKLTHLRYIYKTNRVYIQNKTHIIVKRGDRAYTCADVKIADEDGHD